MPPARWKSGRSASPLQDTDWSSVVQAPAAWSPKWASPTATPDTGSPQFEWAARRPQAVLADREVSSPNEWPLDAPDLEQDEHELQDIPQRAVLPGWHYAHPRNVLAAFSCCAVFSIIAIPLLTGVAHSEPKIDKLSILEEPRDAHSALAESLAPAHGHAGIRFREPVKFAAEPDAANGYPSAVVSPVAGLTVFKSLKTHAQVAGMPAFGSSRTDPPPAIPAATAGAFSSVQSVVASQQMSALAALVAPDASLEPVGLAALPISIERPSPVSIQPLAEYILPVQYDMPSTVLPIHRLRSVVAMTLISDVSTMDLMMPIAEPDLDITSNDSVWAQVGRQFSIDPLLLYSVALVESKSLHPSGQVAPTPWLFRVNDRLVTGERHHVQMQMAMAGQLNSAVQDVGIMQVYYPMHRNEARDPLTLLDPRTNITVGAKILKDGMHQTRDPVLGVGYYHSHTPSLALNYGTAVMIVYQRLKGVYRHVRYVPVAAHPGTRSPVRLASGYSDRPSRGISARSRVLSGQCLFL